MRREEIRIENLSKTYKTEKVLDINKITIQQGKIYGLLGLNGAGKSTLMKILLSLISANSGEITIFGEKITSKNRSYLDKIGALIEEPAYYPNLSGYENLLLLQKMLGFDEANIDETLKLVDLYSQRKKLVKNYSLGMKQRLGIALALVKKPELLILDEPTNGLDPEGIQEIRGLLKRLSQEKGLTIVISSHILSEIEQMADRVGIIHQGRLLYESDMEQIEARKWLSIKLRGADLPSLEELIKSEGLTLLESGSNELNVSNLEPEPAAELLSLLVHKGYPVYEFSSQQESLEDIFLRISKG